MGRLSNQPFHPLAMENRIPDKLYFKIGEVSHITGVKPHVLRYWESEFSAIRPQKSKNQQRLYRKKDILTVLYLKDLLYNQGFTIAGARKRIKEALLQNSSPPSRKALIDELKSDLVQLRKSLDSLPQ